MSQSYDAARMLGSEQETYIPMYTQLPKPKSRELYVIKRDSKAETSYISYIGKRRNYTTELTFALTFGSKAEAEKAAAPGETVCLLAEESLYHG